VSRRLTPKAAQGFCSDFTGSLLANRRVAKPKDRSGNPAGATNGSDEVLERIARFFALRILRSKIALGKKCARISFCLNKLF
jgi:hypothetical protein